METPSILQAIFQAIKLRKSCLISYTGSFLVIYDAIQRYIHLIFTSNPLCYVQFFIIKKIIVLQQAHIFKNLTAKKHGCTYYISETRHVLCF